MQYKITKQAQETLMQIYDVFLEFAGQRNADKIIERVDDRLNTLLKHPYIGHPEMLLADRKRVYRAVSINKNYRMIYYTTRKTIWIVDFWDRRRDPAKLAWRVK